ncbi:hypothetical protein ACFYT7_12225 [Streptomyces sp. NPDC004041]
MTPVEEDARAQAAMPGGVLQVAKCGQAPVLFGWSFCGIDR